MNGWRWRLTSWLVKMLTTAGIALRAPSLKDAVARAGASDGGSLTVTTLLRAFQASRSGRSVETTNRTARQTVAVWAKTSQSLRMGQEFAGQAPAEFLVKNGFRQHKHGNCNANLFINFCVSRRGRRPAALAFAELSLK